MGAAGTAGPLAEEIPEASEEILESAALGSPAAEQVFDPNVLLVSAGVADEIAHLPGVVVLLALVVVGERVVHARRVGDGPGEEIRAAILARA